ncbi:MAG: FMN-binding protein [Treponema sp.]|nr:FMN-binding protein [Treponema sp.]
MKKRRAVFGLCAALVFITGCFSGPKAELRLRDGVYEGTGQGYRGKIRVRVLVREAGIEDVEILDNSEDEAVGGPALEELREIVLEYGSPDVDIVSGATVSSRGFLDALEDALNRQFSF